MAGNSGLSKLRGKPFPKGVSGNPSGLPKPVHEFVKELQQLIRDRCAHKAVDTLEACLEHPDGRVQMAAVREVLDRIPLPKAVAVTEADGSPVKPPVALADILRGLLRESP